MKAERTFALLLQTKHLRLCLKNCMLSAIKFIAEVRQIVNIHGSGSDAEFQRTRKGKPQVQMNDKLNNETGYYGVCCDSFSLSLSSPGIDQDMFQQAGACSNCHEGQWQLSFFTARVTCFTRWRSSLLSARRASLRISAAARVHLNGRWGPTNQSWRPWNFLPRLRRWSDSTRNAVVLTVVSPRPTRAGAWQKTSDITVVSLLLFFIHLPFNGCIGS